MCSHQVVSVEEAGEGVFLPSLVWGAGWSGVGGRADHELFLCVFLVKIIMCYFHN